MMKTTLLRSAIFAATRVIRDGTEHPDLEAEVVDAHVSIFDTEPDRASPFELAAFREAVEVAGDLVNFGRTVQGVRND